MSSREDQFRQRLRATFTVEAEEHVRGMATGLLALERDPEANSNAEQLEAIFRAAHSLKGAARAVNAAGIEAICQSLEGVFAAWKRREITVTPEAFDTLQRAIDLVGKLAVAVDGNVAGDGGVGTSIMTRNLDLIISDKPVSKLQPDQSTLRSHGESKSTEAPTPAQGGYSEVQEPPALLDTVRVSTAKLDRLLLRTEELLTLKQIAAQRVADVRQCEVLCAQWSAEWTKTQANVRKSRSAAGLSAFAREQISTVDPQDLGVIEFLDWNIGFSKTLSEKLRLLGKAVAQDKHVVDGLLNDLVNDSKTLVMLPFSALSDFFPLVVRDLARDQGKEADLIVRGGEVEMDKRILEEMKDPLNHLLRNSLDHGVEKPEVRKQLGKPARATITIAVGRVNGNKIEIRVSDDGAGIRAEQVKEAAFKRGIITREDLTKLDDKQAVELIFQSEVSTSPILTEISGRGLGLAIVREKTERLGGRVTVDSDPDGGATFRLLLPVSLATFRGVLVRAADQPFVIPTANVQRVARIKRSNVKTVENRETIDLGGRAVSLARLERVLNLPRRSKPAQPSDFLSIIVTGSGDEQVAFAVDEVVREEEVLVKSLARPLSRVRNVSGATIVESGKLVPVLNVTDLMISVRTTDLTPASSEEDISNSGEIITRKRILVAEDSITSRMLLKNILESAGHEVKTAVDGMAALAELKANEFDLVVSDIEMPRMNGFDLISKIRSDRRLADIPVILVTALASREDRERGIDVGASAYIVKSSFDQSNLLETVRRLT